MEPLRSDSESSESSLGTLGSPLRSESQEFISSSDRQVSQVSQVSPDSDEVVEMKNAIDGMKLDTLPGLKLQKTEEDLKCYTTFMNHAPVRKCLWLNLRQPVQERRSTFQLDRPCRARLFLP